MESRKWNPERLVALFKKTGARYFFAMGNHHDNMDLWDSKYQSWNSVNMGPKRNVLGEWEKAARKNKLPFGVSIHSSHAWTWYETAQGADKKGPYAGISYDARVVTKEDGKGKWWEGYDPQELYVQNHALSGHAWAAWDWPEGTSVPPQSYYDNFFDRTVDMINKYHPDLVYFDDSVLPFWPINDTGLKVVSHYYNQNMKLHKGNLNAVVFGKKLEAKHKEAIVWDVEKGFHRNARTRRGKPVVASVLGTITALLTKTTGINQPRPSSTCSLTSSVKWQPITKRTNERKRHHRRQGRKILEDIAAWMEVNGEGIFDTRPWCIYGEGPSTETAIPLDGAGFNEGKNAPYTSADIRFVKKGNTCMPIS